MKRPALVLVAAPAAAVLATGAYLAWPRGASPVTEQEALADFRAQPTTTPPDAATEAPALPEPGVYTYASSGGETVELGVLPPETRTYPDTMSVVIVDTGSGCFTATLNLLDQHTEDTTYCADDSGGLRIDSHEKHQQIGALRPTASMACDPAKLVHHGDEAADPSCTITLSGGPAALTATVAGTTEVSEATVRVGEDEVDALAVDVTYEISGDLTGTWHEQTWFADDWLPLRIERSLDLDGLADFTERSTLVLADATPSR